MKKVLFVFTLLFGCFGLPYVNAVNLEPKVDKKSQERIIITTDLEVDDMNGIILSLMYADQYDLAGILPHMVACFISHLFHFPFISFPKNKKTGVGNKLFIFKGVFHFK